MGWQAHTAGYFGFILGLIKMDCYKINLGQILD